MKLKKNLRKGEDMMIKSKRALLLLAWVLFASISGLLSTAKPKESVLLSRFFGSGIQGSWDAGRIETAFILGVVLVCTCFMGLLVDSRRMRRKDDRYSLSFIIFGSLSLLGVLLYPFLI